MIEVSRSVHVSLAQRYWNFDWDPAANHAAYGAQASAVGVGANLRLALSCHDERDLEPGVARMKALVDHRALFKAYPEFAQTPSTLEHVTQFLAARHGAASWRTLTVDEDERLSCVADAGGGLTLRERVFNLTLECTGAPDVLSGLLRIRGRAARAVRAAAPQLGRAPWGSRAEWAEAVFETLRRGLPDLTALELTLNPRETIRVVDRKGVADV